MKDVLIVLFCNIPCGLAVFGSYHLAFNDKAGWGWMIVLAICLQTSYKFKNKKGKS